MERGKRDLTATLRAQAAGRGKASRPAAGGRDVRLGIYIPPELRKRVRLAAAERGETLSALVVRAIERELERER